MARKKQAYLKKPFESRKTGEVSKSHEPFVAMYQSLTHSDAFLSLKPSAKVLYIYMREQYKPVDKLPKGLKENEFRFNQSIWYKQLGLYTNKNKFYADRDILVEHGFIDVVESGRNTRTKAIYRFSDRWQEYGKGQ